MKDILSAIIANKVTGGGGSGSGLPAGGSPHQMLVTDADGNTVWEDRTHYAYETTTTIVEKQTVTTAVGDGFTQATLTNEAVLQGGKTYKVAFEGNEYRCICKYLSDYDIYYIGNIAITPMDSEDTGEPFMILSMASQEVTGLFVSRPVGTYEIAVELLEETVQQLDEKYIPDSVMWVTVDTDLNADKTHSEMYNALQNGTDVIVLYNHCVYRLVGYTPDDDSRVLSFSLVAGNADLVMFFYLTVSSDNTITTGEYTIYQGDK